MATSDVESISESILGRIQRMHATEWMPAPRAATIELLADGTYHANFVVRSIDRQFVARYNRSSQWGLSSADQLAREFRVLLDLSSSAATPTPLAFETETDHPFLLESFVDGKKFDYETDLEACAVAIATTHRCAPRASASVLPRVSPTQFLLDDGVDWIRRVGSSPVRLETVTHLAEAERRLRTQDAVLDSPWVIVHTDLIQPNILRTPERCVLVDWEGAKLGPRAWDLAYFLSPVTLCWADPPPVTIGDERRRAFLQAYADTASIGLESLEHEVNTISPYVIFRAIAWCAGYAASESDISRRARDTIAYLCDPGFIDEHLLRGIR